MLGTMQVARKSLRRANVPVTHIAGAGLRTREFSSDSVDHSTYVQAKFQGRQSVSGITATVFGATGFTGRFVVNKLGRVGSQVIIPFRGDGMNTRHMKLMGDLGQIQPIPIDMTDPDTLIDAAKRSNVVINLLGSNYVTRNYNYHDVNVKCVHRLAKAVAKEGVCKRFIHVSALGADLNSPSEFLRSKAEGEEVVKEFFPNATILRPAPIFGQEAPFLNIFARNVSTNYYIPIVGSGDGKVQPLYVTDFAQAIVNSIVHTDAPGSTYDLYGPTAYNTRQMYDIVSKGILRTDYQLIQVDERLAKKAAWFLERFLPAKWIAFTSDMVEQASMDIVAPMKSEKTLADLKIKPWSLEAKLNWCMMNYTGQRNDLVWEQATRGKMNAHTKQMYDSGYQV